MERDGGHTIDDPECLGDEVVTNVGRGEFVMYHEVFIVHHPFSPTGPDMSSG